MREVKKLQREATLVQLLKQKRKMIMRDGRIQIKTAIQEFKELFDTSLSKMDATGESYLEAHI